MRRRCMQFVWMGVDVSIMAAATIATCFLLERIPSREAYLVLAAMAGVRIVVWARMGMYRAEPASTEIYTQFVAAIGTAAGSIAAIALGYFFLLEHVGGLGRAFFVLEGLLTLMICGGLRMFGRLLIERRTRRGGQRVVIYGAGGLGELVMRNLSRIPGYSPIGFLDDDPRRKGAIIHGRKVLGGLRDLSAICARQRPDLLILAISNLDLDTTRAVFRACMARSLRMQVVQGVGGALNDPGASSRFGLRELALEDLLRRPSRSLDMERCRRLVAGKRVLVTGAGGSIGSELARQLAQLGAAHLDLLDQNELGLYHLENELRETRPGTRLTLHLVDLRDAARTAAILEGARPHVVYHAAAYKHVPMVEENPFAGIANNVGGFRNLLHHADRVGVDELVMISTDKAVRPTNVMGASKRVCELLLQSMPLKHTAVCAVRFGNVIGSSGSVVPRFLEQIERGGPVTVTHPEMTRYFMLIPEAVSLVLQASTLCRRDERDIFLLDMGDPVRIADMARQLIFLAGHLPDRDIEITYTGLRPGEKLYEELLIDGTQTATEVPLVYRADVSEYGWERFDERLVSLLRDCEGGDFGGLTLNLKALVPEWEPAERCRDALLEATEGESDLSDNGVMGGVLRNHDWQGS